MNASRRRIVVVCAAILGGVVIIILAGLTAALFTRGLVVDIISDNRAIVSPNGVEESKAIELGGIRQWVTIRGRDRRNPILLVLHGGPGSPMMATSYLFQSPWEDHFTVVQWDQRGAGKTYALNDPKDTAPTMSIERMLGDTEELVTYLRRTFGKEKIFVLGHSWGSVLGLNLAIRHPEWLHAYIGMGQIINMREGERLGYNAALKAAQLEHNEEAVRELTAIAPYPEIDGKLPREKILIERKWSDYYGALTYGRHSIAYETAAMLLSPDYRISDLYAMSTSGTFSLDQLLTEWSRVDFTSVRALGCPIVLLAGRHDFTTPSSVAAQWFAELNAPKKQLVWFENSAHMIVSEEPGKLLAHLIQDARPLAVEAGDGVANDE